MTLENYIESGRYKIKIYDRIWIKVKWYPFSLYSNTSSHLLSEARENYEIKKEQEMRDWEVWLIQKQT